MLLVWFAFIGFGDIWSPEAWLHMAIEMLGCVLMLP